MYLFFCCEDHRIVFCVYLVLSELYITSSPSKGSVGSLLFLKYIVEGTIYLCQVITPAILPFKPEHSTSFTLLFGGKITGNCVRMININRDGFCKRVVLLGKFKKIHVPMS